MSRRWRVLAAALALSVAGVVAGATVPRAHAHGRVPVGAVHVSGETAQDVVTGRLLFVGASYSIGLGATNAAEGYASLLADRMHQPYSVNAVSGTGFQNAGRHHSGTFAERIARIPVLPAPSIVVIQGGRDDTRFPSSREYAAALDTIQLAQHRFRSARVVVLGPIPAVLPVSTRILAIRSAIGQACRAARAGFIDPIAQRWITPENIRSYSGRIHGHPNDAGYAYITTRLIAALPAALHASQPPLQPLPTPSASPTTAALT